MNEKYLKIGQVNSSHGIKGEFNFFVLNPESRTIQKNSSILIKNTKLDFEKMNVEDIRYGNKIILKISGINSKTNADSIVPFEVFIERSDLPDLEDDEYYINDLLGFEVTNLDGKKIGELKDYYETPLHVVMVIGTGSKNIDVIFNNIFVKNVDIETKKISIIVPEEVE